PADRRRPALSPQREHRLPALRAVPAHGRRPERRLRAAPEEGPEGRGAAPCQRGPRAAAQNVGYGLRQKKVPKDEERRRASEALGLVRLSGYERRRTWELSGGQPQRVAPPPARVN